MINKIFFIPIFSLLFFFFIPLKSVSATETLRVYHPNWQDKVQISDNKFCRISNGNCAKIEKQTPSYLTVKWDKWGCETYHKLKGNYDLVVLKSAKDTKIEEEYQQLDYTFEHPFIKLNPYGNAPMSVMIKFPTDEAAKITLTVKGKDGQKDIVRVFKDYQTQHTLDVHGLYPQYENKVEIIAQTKSGREKKKTWTIKTSKYFGKAFYKVLSKKDAKDIYYFTFDGYIVDEYGNVRYAFTPKGLIAYYLNGEIVTEARKGGLSTYTMMGKLTGRYRYPKGFTSFQHGLNVMPNGNFLVLGRQEGLMALNGGVNQQTNWDQIIELDKMTGALVKRWDLGAILNPDRKTIAQSPTTAPDNDWSHLNSVVYDETDDTLVLSARHIGMVKIAYADGALKWVVSPNLEFDKSGRDGKGPSVADKVLTAVDATGKPYPEKVQKGFEIHPDFKWPTRNHDAKIIGDGLFSIFDNSREINNSSVAVTKDSNAIIYQVDSVTMTIRQIWSKPLDDYSAVGSGMTYLPKENDVVVYISEVTDKNSHYTYGLIQRYLYDTKEKLFEALLLKKGWIYRVDPFDWNTVQ